MSQTPHGPTGSTGSYSSPNEPNRGAFSGVKQQVKEKTSEVMSQVQERAASAVESQKSTAADRLGHIAQAIRQAGNNLDDDPAVSKLADRAAQTVERFSDSIRQHEWTDIVRSAEDFARRNPALFIGGAFAAGLLVARFLKSSRHQRHEMYPYQSQMSGSRFARDDARYYDEGDEGDEYGAESLYGSKSASTSGSQTGTGSSTSGSGVSSQRGGQSSMPSNNPQRASQSSGSRGRDESSNPGSSQFGTSGSQSSQNRNQNDRNRSGGGASGGNKPGGGTSSGGFGGDK